MFLTTHTRPLAVLLSAVVLGSCRQPTGVELMMSTDIDCRDMGSTAIVAYSTSTAPDDPATTTEACQPDGTIGTLVVVPASERDESLQVRVITSIGVPVEQCLQFTAGSPCIESRRRLHFLPHEMLRLPVRQELDCRGVACGETLTCRKGACVSDEVDPDVCVSDPGRCGEVVPANVRQVGPGKAYADPCAAIAAAKAGDIIEVDPGTYTVACTVPISLTVRGVGGGARPVLQALAPVANGKGILAVEGDGVDFVAENLEFTGAVTAGQYHAGLFFRGHDLTVRNCLFHGNDSGLLTGPSRSVTIEASEFDRNGSALPDVAAHNVNIGDAESFTFRASWSRRVRGGHLLKSRARRSVIVASRLTDGDSTTTSDNVDLPVGGTGYLIGNLIEQSDGNNSNMVRLGEEGNLYGDETRLVLVHNTLVNRANIGAFVRITGEVSTPTVLVNNLFFGQGSLPASATAAGNQNRPIGALGAELVDAAAYDYRLQPGAPAVDAGVDAAAYLDGIPLLSYVHPGRTEPRQPRGAAPDSGAYERVD